MHNNRCKTCGRRQNRSNPANARYWLLLHTIAEKLKVRGELFSAEAWHHYHKQRWLGSQDFRLPNGKTMLIPKSTADLDTAAFNDYMTKVEAWASERDVWLDSMEEA